MSRTSPFSFTLSSRDSSPRESSSSPSPSPRDSGGSSYDWLRCTEKLLREEEAERRRRIRREVYPELYERRKARMEADPEYRDRVHRARDVSRVKRAKKIQKLKEEDPEEYRRYLDHQSIVRQKRLAEQRGESFDLSEAIEKREKRKVRSNPLFFTRDALVQAAEDRESDFDVWWDQWMGQS